MFIINLTYIAPLEKVDFFREEHLAFLRTYYSQSIFLYSGPKIPRNGGIIIAHNVEKEELMKIIQEDPFWKNEIADYEITEFTPTMSASPV